MIYKAICNNNNTNHVVDLDNITTLTKNHIFIFCPWINKKYNTDDINMDINVSTEVDIFIYLDVFIL